MLGSYIDLNNATLDTHVSQTTHINLSWLPWKSPFRYNIFISNEDTPLLRSVPRVEDSRGLRLVLIKRMNLERFPAQRCTCRRHEGRSLSVGRIFSHTG
jgi:hypothetical protein